MASAQVGHGLFSRQGGRVRPHEGDEGIEGAASQAEYGLAAQHHGLKNLRARGSGEHRIVPETVGEDVADGVVEAVGVAREQHAARVPADDLAVHHGERLEVVPVNGVQQRCLERARLRPGLTPRRPLRAGGRDRRTRHLHDAAGLDAHRAKGHIVDVSCPKGHDPLLIQGLLDGMGRETWAWPSSVNRQMDYKEGEARQRRGAIDL